MAKIEIYTMPNCPFCVRAKQLLDRKKIAYEEIRVAHDDDAKWRWLAEATGQRTLPQVFADGKSLGGFSDIDALDKQGKLDPILDGQ